jgi:hypothetical protein
MKELVLLILVASIGSITISAQEATATQKQKEIQTKGQAAVQKENLENQGQTVSQVAKETPSGPGKGQVVSQAARTKIEAKSERGPSRPDAAGLGATKGPARSTGQNKK